MSVDVRGTVAVRQPTDLGWGSGVVRLDGVDETYMTFGTTRFGGGSPFRLVRVEQGRGSPTVIRSLRSVRHARLLRRADSPSRPRSDGRSGTPHRRNGWRRPSSPSAVYSVVDTTAPRPPDDSSRCPPPPRGCTARCCGSHASLSRLPGRTGSPSPADCSTESVAIRANGWRAC